ncbi:unnamed protein product [Bursaphelenchus okinawaensis]|uniref:G-protein coupled receptors family 1 profile domain-containing protein n=1 Tax=Bursaphelenchus okinawaensis TaxID=465554 RepID=A0A811L3K1_9BILA|nr:unnamed protein product [Bursaphelenchus okinawaensis]CAG9115341.1 unnamed protein product [Bursaphelenchus okinawaensis]
MCFGWTDWKLHGLYIDQNKPNFSPSALFCIPPNSGWHEFSILGVTTVILGRSRLRSAVSSTVQVLLQSFHISNSFLRLCQCLVDCADQLRTIDITLQGYAFSLMETGICMIIPTVLIILFNVLVILKLRSHFKNIPASPSVSFNTADTVYSTGPSHTIKSTKVSKASMHHLSVNGTNSAETMALRYKRCSLRYADLQLTRSLVIVTSVFILLNLPNYLYRIAVQYLKISDQSEVMQWFSLAAHVLLYTHHAILFYMYIFNSPQMRRRLLPTALKLLECYCLKPVQDYSENGINY